VDLWHAALTAAFGAHFDKGGKHNQLDEDAFCWLAFVVVLGR
jgi:hypothetical protein